MAAATRQTASTTTTTRHAGEAVAVCAHGVLGGLFVMVFYWEKKIFEEQKW